MGAFAFADDLLLITKNQVEANHMLELVDEWANQFNLRVNVDKTEMITELECQIQYRGELVTKVKLFKYLGRIFQQDGGYEEHIRK